MTATTSPGKASSSVLPVSGKKHWKPFTCKTSRCCIHSHEAFKLKKQLSTFNHDRRSAMQRSTCHKLHFKYQEERGEKNHQHTHKKKNQKTEEPPPGKPVASHRESTAAVGIPASNRARHSTVPIRHQNRTPRCHFPSRWSLIKQADVPVAAGGGSGPASPPAETSPRAGRGRAANAPRQRRRGAGEVLTRWSSWRPPPRTPPPIRGAGLQGRGRERQKAGKEGWELHPHPPRCLTGRGGGWGGEEGERSGR